MRADCVYLPSLGLFSGESKGSSPGLLEQGSGLGSRKFDRLAGVSATSQELARFKLAKEVDSLFVAVKVEFFTDETKKDIWSVTANPG